MAKGRRLPLIFHCVILAAAFRLSEAMTETLVVNEIYCSLQGESTLAGLPCVFVRLTACNLRCSYCDTAYAFSEGKKMPVSEVLQEVFRQSGSYEGRKASGMRLPLVELTGGEP